MVRGSPALIAAAVAVWLLPAPRVLLIAPAAYLVTSPQIAVADARDRGVSERKTRRGSRRGCLRLLGVRIGKCAARSQTRRHGRRTADRSKAIQVVRSSHTARVPSAAVARSAPVVSVQSSHSTALSSLASTDKSSSRAESEIVAIGLDDAARARLSELGFVEIEAVALEATAGTMLRLRIPQGRSQRAAIRSIMEIAPDATVAPNDLYVPYSQCGAACLPMRMLDWSPEIGRCLVHAEIGMIDTAVDTSAESLRYADIVQKTLVSANRSRSSPQHGTGVASLLVGRGRDGAAGLLPRASLYSADVFFATEEGDRADAFGLAKALDWLASVPVAVTNMSLGGPDNAVLEHAISIAIGRGMVIVAASGRRSGSKRPGYPAAYDDVIAVTAIDDGYRPLAKSSRSESIDFAAPGVAMPGSNAGQPAGDDGAGSSFAAPYVTAAYAVALSSGLSPRDATGALAGSARDLGTEGRDPVFGWGLLQASHLARCGRN